MAIRLFFRTGADNSSIYVSFPFLLFLLAEHHPVPHHSGRGGPILLASITGGYASPTSALDWWWWGGIGKGSDFGHSGVLVLEKH
jgi:hypothetical protein